MNKKLSKSSETIKPVKDIAIRDQSNNLTSNTDEDSKVSADIALDINQVDFVALKEKFNSLSNTNRAAIERVSEPEEVRTVKGSYLLLPTGHKLYKQWQRVIFILPYINHHIDEQGRSNSVGANLARAGITEQRIRYMIANSSPVDLKLFKALCQQSKLACDWQIVGKQLYFWGDKVKAKILADYYQEIATEQK